MCPPGNCPFANDFLITHALGHMECSYRTYSFNKCTHLKLQLFNQVNNNINMT